MDGHSIKVEPDKKLTPGGRALSAIAKVVTFDLACVAASMMGLGNHPRFLVHDSPREGEMKPELYVVYFLESLSKDNENVIASLLGRPVPWARGGDDNKFGSI